MSEKRKTQREVFPYIHDFKYTTASSHYDWQQNNNKILADSAVHWKKELENEEESYYISNSTRQGSMDRIFESILVVTGPISWGFSK